ncbi:MAG: hypothetical protein ACI31M_04950 [Bacilli bacterium]
MQYSFHNEKDNVDVVLSDTLVDLVYDTQVAQEIGLLGVALKIKEIEQEKEIQESFKDIVDWVKKNVVEYKYATQIVNRITFALKYGISTITKSNDQNQSISFVLSNNENYKLFISKENDVLSVQTDVAKGNNKLSTSIVVNLNTFDDEGKELHSTIEEIIVATRVYEVDGKTYKSIDSIREKRFYQTIDKISHSINEKTEIKQIINNPEIENNIDILKEQRRILTKYPCKDSSIIACIYNEYNNINGVKSNNNMYYLSRNNSINSLRLENNNTKCPISLEQYKDARKGMLNIEELVEGFEIENFTHVAKIPDFYKNKYLKKKKS